MEPLAALPLSITHKQKKPSALVPWQAYSQLYFTKGSALHREVHADYADFKAGKSVTRSKYEHLFPNLEEDSLSTINWLPFYQAVMTERVKNASEVELTAVAEYIENRHQKELNIHERPWDAYGGGEDDSEESKKKRYLEMCVVLVLFFLYRVERPPGRLRPSQTRSRMSTGKLKTQQTSVSFPSSVDWLQRVEVFFRL